MPNGFRKIWHLLGKSGWGTCGTEHMVQTKLKTVIRCCVRVTGEAGIGAGPELQHDPVDDFSKTGALASTPKSKGYCDGYEKIGHFLDEKTSGFRTLKNLWKSDLSGCNIRKYRFAASAVSVCRSFEADMHVRWTGYGILVMRDPAGIRLHFTTHMTMCGSCFWTQLSRCVQCRRRPDTGKLGFWLIVDKRLNTTSFRFCPIFKKICSLNVFNFPEGRPDIYTSVSNLVIVIPQILKEINYDIENPFSHTFQYSWNCVLGMIEDCKVPCEKNANRRFGRYLSNPSLERVLSFSQALKNWLQKTLNRDIYYRGALRIYGFQRVWYHFWSCAYRYRYGCIIDVRLFGNTLEKVSNEVDRLQPKRHVASSSPQIPSPIATGYDMSRMRISLLSWVLKLLEDAIWNTYGTVYTQFVTSIAPKILIIHAWKRCMIRLQTEIPDKIADLVRKTERWSSVVFRCGKFT